MMMRKFFSAVLEQGNSFSQDFETEPYEAGWASEARWFIRVLDASGSDVTLLAVPQISPDGLVWCDDNDASGELELRADAVAPTMISFNQREFGNWLRLKVRVAGNQPSVKVLVYLALKE